MNNAIIWIFIFGFLGSIICFTIMIIKGIKRHKIFNMWLIIILAIFLSMMSLSIGIKLAIINSNSKKNVIPSEYKDAIENFNNGDFNNSIKDLDKSLTKNRDEEYLYKYSIIRLIILTSEGKSYNYLIDVFAKAAEKGKFFYSYDELIKLKKSYEEMYTKSQLKEQQINDNLLFIINNMDEEKTDFKISLKYKYKDEKIKDLLYFKSAAYPIPTETEIELCRKQAFNYNVSKITEECIKNSKINYPKLLYTSANILNTKKHKDTYERCLKKIREITKEKDEYRKKAEEDLKKIQSK